METPNNLSGRMVIYLVSLASIFLIMAGVRDLALIINPILLAIVITITVLPIPGKITKKGLPGWTALVLTILLVVLMLGLVLMTVFTSIVRLSTELPIYLAQASSRALEELPTWAVSQEAVQSPTEISIEFGPMIEQIVGIVVNLLTQFGLALFIFFFMISSAISIPNASRLGLDPNAAIIGRISELTEDVRRYMSILTGINFLVGLGNTVFLWFLGVDYAILWGVLAWFMGYIPSIGFIIALIPPLVLAWAQYGFQTALIVLVGFVLINGGVQNFIQPKIMGKGLKISPVVVFIGLILWGFLLGGIGAILAVPLTLLVLIIMENFDGTRPLAILMRYTGERDEEDQKEALREAKDFWKKARKPFHSQDKSDN